MKLGIFDSGLGGLVITKAIRDVLPEHDIMYLGDTLRLPYGNRSTEAIYEFTRRSMQYLLDQDCALIIVACNTASAAALRTLQQEFLPTYKSETPRNIIGVVVPTLEAAAERGTHTLGMIATNYIINSDVFKEELEKIDSTITLVQKATPLLVSLVENDGMQWAPEILTHYLKNMRAQNIETLALGCTHYPHFKPQLRNILGDDFPLLSQDDIIPIKLKEYLERHPEYNQQITKNAHTEFYVTDLTQNYIQTARKIYGEDITVNKVKI